MTKKTETSKTLKEIWSTFWNNTKSNASKAWEGIKKVCTSTFDILKNAVIAFVTGVYDWIVKVITGFGQVIWAFLEFLITSLGNALFQTFKLWLDKLVAWITKW